MSGVVLVPEGPDAGMVYQAGDPLGEQRAMEAGLGVLKLSSREVFTVTGAERLSWLHSLTTQDLAKLPAGVSVPILVLSPTGQIEHGFHLIDDGTTSWCWTEPGARAVMIGFLESMKFWTQVEIAARDDVALWWIGRAETEIPEPIVSFGTTIGAGCFGLFDSSVTLAGTPVGQWAFEALRVMAGVPRIGIDTDGRTLPNELGLYGTALDKGCYRGQETVARVHNLGRPPRRLVRLLLDGDLPEAGAAIQNGERAIGVFSSPAQHHELGPIGLGLVKRSVPVDATLEVGGIAAAQEAIVDPEVGEHFRAQL